MKNLLITFDVDGTLTKSGENANRLHKRAFEYAFEKLFGVCGTVEAVPLHGKTDQMIILDCLEHYGIPRAVAKPRLKEVMDKMVEYCEENRGDVKQGLELLPGVLALLQCLSHRDDIVFGLVTGNLEEIAWIKMEGLGIRQFFTKPNFGGCKEFNAKPHMDIVGMCGFGSDHTDRGELVNLATRRATKCFPGGFRLRAHIGDTPADIQAAHHGQALAIGVCTGAFSRCELEHAGASFKRISAEGRGGIDIPTVVLDDLTDTRAFFCAVGLC